MIRMSYIGVNAEWLKQHDKEVREKVLEEVRTACIRDESVGCTIFRILQEIRQSKDREL
jgi:NurA-like 5'-3' nuclease